MPKITRKIVRIDEDKCDGCGLCVPDCAEGAIQVVDGKARLVAENLCDGLGNCLGTCPNDAITIEERPADEFDEQAVAAHGRRLGAGEAETPAGPPSGQKPGNLPCGCPGTMMRKLSPSTAPAAASRDGPCQTAPRPSRLGQWPVQLTLLPTSGSIWQDADVLMAADCVGFAMPDFHERLLEGKTLAVACPKLDDVEPYVGKLAAVFANNSIRSVTVARMEVPCCGGLEQIVRAAMEKAGVTIPLTVVVVGAEGRVLAVSGAGVIP
jgi:NAD-dependent dihydropyrimidine dehydrogenase PreA subunit